MPDEDGCISRLISISSDITWRRQLEEDLEFQSLHDSLTGLDNRRALEQQLEEELKRAARYGHDLSIFLLDLDYFKKINDNYGHKAGDIVLMEVAAVLEDLFRDCDHVARYGGEEFVVVLQETAREKAEKLAERVRKRIAEHPIEIEADIELRIIVTIGIATFPEHANSWERLLDVADKAMYVAKGDGRNRCRVGKRE